MEGISTINLGKCVSQEMQAKREEICMGWDKNFRQSMFLHEGKVENKKERLELEQPWTTNYRAYWSISGAFWN
jgi:hypothetical protein